jgi:hypothetical protein
MMNRRGMESYWGTSYDPVASVFIFFEVAGEVRESNLEVGQVQVNVRPKTYFPNGYSVV